MKKNRLNRVYRRVDRMVSMFTNLIDALEGAIIDLQCAISENDTEIAKLNGENVDYAHRIEEYNSLKTNVERIVH